VLLGTHPPVLPVAALVRVGELFGIAEGTIRVALSRMTADGELVTDNGCYRLGRSLEHRQAVQDRGRRPDVRPWAGAWELVVATDARPPTHLAPLLDELRLAPTGGQVWMRPANLVRPPDQAWPAGTRRLEADGDGDVAADRALAASLWDLEGWAADGHQLLEAFAGAERPAGRFVVAAAILRHLRLDPVLPPALVDPSWPDGDLREAYSAFTRELGDILAATTGH
jgi:phenylacetic acid degradation operon negative regulatory protein